MIKKILSVLAKIIVGIFVFYVFVGFVVFPMALSWGIKSQGTKILQHPVGVRSVHFNPFLLRLSIEGFQILGKNKSVMAGFERFFVDVSFLNLLKGQYRVEAVGLDGLQVNVVMAEGGKINVLELVPPVPAASLPSVVSKSAPVAVEAKSVAVPPLPLVIIDDIAVKRGTIHFTDETITPKFSTTLNGIDIHITGLTTRPEDVAKVIFEARLDEKGKMSSETMIKPFLQPLELETTFSLNSYAMTILTPYVGKYAGRELKDGNMEFRMDYRISSNKLTASHKLLIQRFTFGQKVESKDALGLPFGLAVALLEDPQGRINVSLPVSGDMSKPDFHYWGLVGQVVRNFFFGLVTKPFAFLASAMGAESGTDELGYIRFLPGKADLADSQKAKMAILVKGLTERPRILLEINGAYDPDNDWKAVKVEALANEYKELRAQFSKSDSDVYQMIYQRRFGIRELWALTKEFKLKEGVYEEGKLVDEVKRQLVEKAPPDKEALKALAQARAQIVYDAILAAGLDPTHVRIGLPHEVQGSMGFVSLEFTLTVFGEDQVSVTSAEPQAPVEESVKTP